MNSLEINYIADEIINFKEEAENSGYYHFSAATSKSIDKAVEMMKKAEQYARYIEDLMDGRDEKEALDELKNALKDI